MAIAVRGLKDYSRTTLTPFEAKGKNQNENTYHLSKDDLRTHGIPQASLCGKDGNAHLLRDKKNA